MTVDGQRQRTEDRTRRRLRPRQPRSTAGLWPSQRRAAEHRTALARERAAETWLRRLARR
jgi:hypothetical protein